MQLKEDFQFLEVRDGGVEFSLTFEMVAHGFEEGVADGEGCIGLLPREFAIEEIMSVDTMGRFTFEVLQNILHGIVRIEEAEYVEMISSSANFLDIAMEIMFEVLSHMFVE